MMEYGNPFEGGGAAVTGGEITTTDAGGDPSTEWDTITATGSTEAVGGMVDPSPLDARIAASNWSREDVELAVKLAGTVATIAAVTMAYQRGA